MRLSRKTALVSISFLIGTILGAAALNLSPAAERTGTSGEFCRREIRTEPGQFEKAASHVQGICCDENAIYLSFANYLFKIDWSGHLLTSAPAESHSGDLCLAGDRIYVSMSAPDRKGIYEYNTELKLLRKIELEYGPATDGIAFMNGSFFIGGPSTSEPHRSNLILEYDRNFQFRRKLYLDFGTPTLFGPQSMTAWNDSLFLAFYTDESAPVRTVRTDGTMKVTGRYSINASNGLSSVPPSKQGKLPRFIMAQTVQEEGAAIAVIRWLELDGEVFRDITE